MIQSCIDKRFGLAIFGVLMLLLAVACGESPPALTYDGGSGDTDSDSDSDSDGDSDGDSDTDSDVDECEEGLDDCDENAICTDLPDGWECECLPGFYGDGTECSWVGFLNMAFWQQYWYGVDYQANYALIGPSTSTDPEDGSWTELAGGAEMQAPDDGADWVLGPILDISSFAGSEVRIAFRYTGNSSEKWYLEDICIGYGDQDAVPDSCDMSAGFDLAAPPALPDQWLSVNGTGDMDSGHNWRTSTDQSISAPTSAIIDRSSGVNSNKFLVSPTFTLPGFD